MVRVVKISWFVILGSFWGWMLAVGWATETVPNSDQSAPSADKEQKQEKPTEEGKGQPEEPKNHPKEGENAPEETVFVADGKPELVEAVGQKWVQGDGFLEGSGPGNLLRTVRAIGSGDFHLKLELTIFQVERSGASIVLGEASHFGFSSGNHRMFVEGPIFPGGQHVLTPTEDHVRDGRRFRLEIIRKENQIRFLVDGQPVYSMLSDGGPIGQVSLRPWRSRMRVHQFTATGRILDIPRPASAEATEKKPTSESTPPDSAGQSKTSENTQPKAAPGIPSEP